MRFVLSFSDLGNEAHINMKEKWYFYGDVS